jgi:hypothetical protein
VQAGVAQRNFSKSFCSLLPNWTKYRSAGLVASYTGNPVPGTMEDKLSSPSSSSQGASVATPVKRQHESDDIALVIRKQPPSHVFSGEVFDIEFDLEVSPGSQYSPPANVEVMVTLDSSKGISKDETKLIILEEPRLSPSRKTGKARCRLDCVILPKERGAAVCIRVGAKKEREISACVTNYIHIVRAKLWVRVDESWGNVWYKDEGGRDKSIEVTVKAFDQQNNIVKERVPLSLKLCYDSPSLLRVSNQHLLRKLGSERTLQIEEQTGIAKIRFRIEDVSKNHQGQDFVVEISADKEFKDFAPATTPPVAVRSKRNKRHRNTPSSGSSRPSIALDRNRNETFLGMQEAAQFSNPVTSLSPDTGRLREALQEVIHWTEEVVNGLYPLQWQVLGYTQNPDGSPDYSRPYHSMTNPNAVISRVLSTYNQSTRDNLNILKQAVDRTEVLNDTSGQSSYAAPANMQRAFDSMGDAGQPQNILPSRQRIDPVYGDYATLQHPSYFPQPPSRTGDPAMLNTPGRRSHHVSYGSQSKINSNEDNPESLVEYVLAKKYKSLHSGEHLGFPAYSGNKEIVGFYREATNKLGASQFVAIGRHTRDFGPFEILQATDILEEAIANKSDAVHALKDWGSIGNLIDHCLVYDFSKDVSGVGGTHHSLSGA